MLFIWSSLIGIARLTVLVYSDRFPLYIVSVQLLVTSLKNEIILYLFSYG